MFTAEHIKQLMTAQPFKPFRLCMSDGKTYAIIHHDAAMVLRHAVEVGVDLDSKGFATNVHRCAILHINRIEDIPVAA
jgi:RNA:NAD 2'-phosphotransferase (TPT1/KptA family)